MRYDNNNYNILTTRDLKEDDRLRFILPEKTFEYTVGESYITGQDKETAILDELRAMDLIQESFFEYCSRLYGYPGAHRNEQDGRWPDCKRHDLPALTRVVYDIFELLNGKGCEKLPLSELSKISFL